MPTVYSPPVPTYVALATETLSGTDASITFSSIPATYRDLVLVINATTTANAPVGVYINGDSGSNYSAVRAYGNIDGAYSQSVSGNYLDFDFGSTDGNNMWFLNFMDYSATDKHKTVLIKANQNAADVTMWASRWANTSAITSLECFTSGSTWTVGSTFSLYGIEA